MTNKEFQEVLKNYPDDYIICMDNVFGWDNYHDLIDPHLFINRDIGQIEIEPDEYKDIWVNPEERLPEDGEDCFVITVCPQKTASGKFHKEKVTYSKAGNMFHYLDDFDGSIQAYDACDVAVWMPIPEPYDDTIKDRID